MKKGTEGALLISVVVGMTIIAVLGTAMVSVVTTSSQTGLKANNANRSFYLAESGVRYANANLAPVTNKTLTLENGDKIEITVSGSGASTEIRSKGIVGQGQAFAAHDLVVTKYTPTSNNPNNPPQPGGNTESYNSNGFYDFGTGSGDTIYDNSGNGNDGTIHNARWTTETPFGEGSAILFESATPSDRQYIQIDDNPNGSLDFTTNGTLSAWIYINKYNPSAGIIHKGNSNARESYTLQMWSGGKKVLMGLNNGAGGAYVVSETKLSTGVWYLVAGTWGADGLRVYINGVEDNFKSKANLSAKITDDPVYIGGQYASGGNRHYFDGIIAKVGFFGRTLDEVELQEVNFGLKARWEFDEGSGIYVYDSATNFSPAFNGTINGYTNGTWVSSSPLGGYALSFCNTNKGIAYNDRQYVFGNAQIVTNFPFTLVNWYKTPPLPRTTRWGKNYTLLELSYDGLHVDDYVRYYSSVGRTGIGTNVIPKLTYMIETASIQNQIDDARWSVNASQTNVVTDDNAWHFQAANFRLYTNAFSEGDYNVCQYKSIYVDDTHVVRDKSWTRRHYNSLVNKWFIGAGRRYTTNGNKWAQGFFNGTLDKASVYSITLQPDVWSNMLNHIYNKTKP